MKVNEVNGNLEYIYLHLFALLELGLLLYDVVAQTILFAFLL